MIRLQVPASLAHRRCLLDRVADACRAAGLDDGDELVIAALTAIGEVFNNIVIHGHADDREGVVGLEFEIDHAGFSCSLIDRGLVFDPSRACAPDLGALPTSGMGLFLVRACVDVVEYAPGPPNRIRLTRRRDRRGRL